VHACVYVYANTYGYLNILHRQFVHENIVAINVYTIPRH
jgi:hypothetical protein